MKTLVDRYRLDYAIGAGGMGIVWRARDLHRQRMVAIKEVRLPEALAEPDRAALADRAIRAAAGAARIEHPGVVTVHEVVVDDGRPWIVMDLVDGRSLDERVRADGPLSPTEAAEIGLTLLDALRAAHEAGIVHGDLKPANVLVRPEGPALLTDFALAATLGDGVPLGDPAYVAPERRRSGEGGPAADLFSLGATLAFATTGRDPSSTESNTALDAVVKALMAGDPLARPSVEAARAALSVAAGRDPDPVPQEPPSPTLAPEAGTTSAKEPEISEKSEMSDQGRATTTNSERPTAEFAAPATTVGTATQATTAANQARPEPRPATTKRKQSPELKVAALVGIGVLAFLIGIGTLGHGGNATPQAAQGATTASPSPATAPDQPSPTADPMSPSASPSAGMASATTARPTKTKTTTAPPRGAILSAEIETDPATYTGPCTPTDLEVEVTLTIRTSQPGTKVTYTATGRGTRTATATDGTYTTTYRVRLDNTRQNTYTFALNVTSPSTASAATTVTDDCTGP
ncbi:protein kinase [Dactylosporangium sp. NPDC048998]|uniref:serine/threonine-protein kinase n=1 Tax=Dactylosporangium sp. NPDC048998 TaxID=3363976 RepID=UPI003715D5F7